MWPDTMIREAYRRKPGVTWSGLEGPKIAARGVPEGRIHAIQTYKAASPPLRATFFGGQVRVLIVTPAVGLRGVIGVCRTNKNALGNRGRLQVSRG